MKEYPVVFQSEPEGGFSVYAPDLPGCVSQGETREEAEENIREAMEGWIEVAKSRGWPVPEPGTSMGTIRVAS